MKKYLLTLLSIGLVATVYGATIFSRETGATPSNGKILQTNGTTNTWVSTSSLGIVSATPATSTFGFITATTSTALNTFAGKVGIGTTTPVVPLQVMGGSIAASEAGTISIRSTTTLSKKLNLGYDDSSDYSWIQSVQTGVAKKNLVLDIANLGVATKTPGNTLTVAGTALVTGISTFATSTISYLASTTAGFGPIRPLFDKGTTTIVIVSSTSTFKTIQSALNQVPIFLQHPYFIYVYDGDYSSEDLIMYPSYGQRADGQRVAERVPFEIRGNFTDPTQVKVGSLFITGLYGDFFSFGGFQVQRNNPYDNESSAIGIYGSQEVALTNIYFAGGTNGMTCYTSRCAIEDNVNFGNRTLTGDAIRVKRHGRVYIDPGYSTNATGTVQGYAYDSGSGDVAFNSHTTTLQGDLGLVNPSEFFTGQVYDGFTGTNYQVHRWVNTTNSADLQYYGAGGSSGVLQTSGGFSLVSGTGADMLFSTNNGDEVMRMKFSKLVGIGTSTPTAKLSVEGDAGSPAFLVASSTGGTQFRIGQTGLQLNGGELPTIATSTGAGTTSSASITGAQNGGSIVLTTGVTTEASSTLFTVTLGEACSLKISPMLFPANINSSGLSGSNMVYASGTSGTKWSLFSGLSALATSTVYQWNYNIFCN